MNEASNAPAPRLRDHLQVLGLLLATILGVVPFLAQALLAPVLTARARARLRRLLSGPRPAPDEADPPDPAAWAGKTIFFVAGEPSGDRLAARIALALRARAPGLALRGYGGPALEAAGVVLERKITDHAVVGVWAVIASLGTWWRLCAETLARWREDRPDLLLTVDFPGLNFRLARWAKRRGIRTVHVVGPQTWAWAPWRTGRVRRALDRLLVTFPFEPSIFRDAGIETAYVGHPLFEAPLGPPRTTEEPSIPPLVELRPGSRRRDVARQAPLVLEAARELSRRRPDTRYLVRLASERGAEAFARVQAGLPGAPPVEVVVGPAPAPRLAAALTTSGTSSAELAVDLVPIVVFYRVSLLARLGKALFVTSPWIALPNLLAGGPVVAEHLVGRRGGPRLGAALDALLGDPAAWRRTRTALEAVRAHVAHPDVADRAARAILAGGPTGSARSSPGQVPARATP